MGKEIDFYTEYSEPEIPSGMLQISSTSRFRFPIKEKSARGLVGELNIVIKKAYLQGLKDGAEPSRKHPKTSCDDKRIQHVYVEDGLLNVASVISGLCVPQSVGIWKGLYSDPDLLADQINGMIDRAEERGCVKGYRARMNDEYPDKPTDDKHIRYAYRDGGSIMVAGKCQDTVDPQSINSGNWKNSDLDLYIQQINNMIDRAKRRGHNLGYQEGFTNGNAGFIRSKKT